MKKLILATAALLVAFAFSSCSGSWNDESKKSMKDNCNSLEKLVYDEADAKALCDCYVDNLVKKYPNVDYTQEQVTEEMDACAKNYKTTAEKKSEMEMQDMNEGMAGDTSTTDAEAMDMMDPATVKH